jgi:two-component system sensor histidine kinase TctE
MPLEAPLLRKQLITWLLVPLFALLIVDSLVSYAVALKFSQRAYDRSLVEIARELALHLRMSGNALALEMPDDVRKILLSDTDDAIFYTVATAAGERVAGDDIPAAPGDASAGHRGEMLYDGVLQERSVRIVEMPVTADASQGRPAGVVRVAETETKRNALAREILVSVVIPQALLILVAGIVVWAGVVHGLAPLERLRRAVAARSLRDWSPVPADGVPGEVRPLLESINELVGRLDQALASQSRFISDAAHQLKTPITVLKTELELALRENELGRMRQALQKSRAGLERLSRVVSQLLSLARNEPDAARSVALAPLDLNALALDVTTGWVPEALKRRIDLGFEGEAAPVVVHGDATRLRELLDNLIDNAVRYSREGGRATVRVATSPTPTLEIRDDGPRIPLEERERVFDRFYRLLGHGQEGSGLGLAIAREIARIHGARIDVAADTHGTGNAFSVRFPPSAA